MKTSKQKLKEKERNQKNGAKKVRNKSIGKGTIILDFCYLRKGVGHNRGSLEQSYYLGSGLKKKETEILNSL